MTYVYQSPFDARDADAWHTQSLVRARAGIAFDLPLDEAHALYNPALTAYAGHPAVLAANPAGARILRAQRLADYLASTELVEIRIVNAAAAIMLACEDMPEAMRIDLLKIYTDEGYHVVMLAEFREHLRRATGIDLQRRESAGLRHILDRLDGLPLDTRALGTICAAIVTETLITSTLRQAGGQGVYPPVAAMLADHAHDENMHHAFFVRYAQWYLPRLSMAQRALVEQLVPEWLLHFLSPNLDQLRRDLCALGVAPAQADAVLAASFDETTWNNLFLSSSLATRALFTRLGFSVAARFEAQVAQAFTTAFYRSKDPHP